MKKLALIFSLMMALGLSAGAYTLSSQVMSKMDCCCCKDSCPMKSKDSSAGAEKQSCCKDGTCPMKSKDAAAKEKSAGCCSCCGDSCSMKPKEKTGSTGDVIVETAQTVE